MPFSMRDLRASSSAARASLGRRREGPRPPPPSIPWQRAQCLSKMSLAAAKSGGLEAGDCESVDWEDGDCGEGAVRTARAHRITKTLVATEVCMTTSEQTFPVAEVINVRKRVAVRAGRVKQHGAAWATSSSHFWSRRPSSSLGRPPDQPFYGKPIRPLV